MNRHRSNYEWLIGAVTSWLVTVKLKIKFEFHSHVCGYVGDFGFYGSLIVIHYG